MSPEQLKSKLPDIIFHAYAAAFRRGGEAEKLRNKWQFPGLNQFKLFVQKILAVQNALKSNGGSVRHYP